jgi:trans-2,3-dihydro-3-hydroxyanthranilate isomerase
MNLSETTFILPREPELEATYGKRVRTFTTREELPFAGHPTLGTALYLYSTTNTAPDEIVLDLNVGKIPVRFTADSTRARNNRAEGDVFGEMRQRDPEFGAILPLEDVARAIGIDAREIASEWPIQVVSTGLSYAIVPFRNLHTLAHLELNFAQAAKFLESAGTVAGFVNGARPSIPRCMEPPVLLDRLRDVESIEIHHLVPGRDKVVNKLLLRIGTGVDFSHCAELRV